VFLVNNGTEATEALAVGGAQSFGTFIWQPPHQDFAALGATAGTDAFRVEMLNLDNAKAADVHATFLYAD